MKTTLETIFTNLIHYFLGPHPVMEVDDIIRLMLVFFVLIMLIGHLVAQLVKPIGLRWIVNRAQKKLARVGTRLSFQMRWEGGRFARKVCVEGTHRGRTVRFFTCGWRGNPMMAVAVACPEPAEFWLQVRPKLGWLMEGLVNLASCRLHDLRSPDLWRRAFPTGDPTFDEAYAVKSNHSDLAIKLLTQEMRTELMAARVPWKNAPTVTITNGEVRYAVQPDIFGTAAAERLVEKLDFVCALAEAEEKLHRQNPPVFASPTASF